MLAPDAQVGPPPATTARHKGAHKIYKGRAGGVGGQFAGLAAIAAAFGLLRWFCLPPPQLARVTNTHTHTANLYLSSDARARTSCTAPGVRRARWDARSHTRAQRQCCVARPFGSLQLARSAVSGDRMRRDLFSPAPLHPLFVDVSRRGLKRARNRKCQLLRTCTRRATSAHAEGFNGNFRARAKFIARPRGAGGRVGAQPVNHRVVNSRRGSATGSRTRKQQLKSHHLARMLMMGIPASCAATTTSEPA